MSFLPESYKKRSKDTLEKVETFNRILGKDVLKIVGKEFSDFENDPANSEAIFYAKSRHFLTIQTPEIAELEGKDGQTIYKNIPVPSTNNDSFYIWRGCKCKLGSITIMGPVDIVDEICISEINVFMSGKFSKQYVRVGTKDYDNQTLEDLCTKYNLDIEKVEAGKDYEISYSLMLYQIIETWE